MISIMIVAELDLVRGALAAVLAHEPDLDIAADLSPAVDIVSAARAHHPAVAIIDIDQSGGDGLAGAERLAAGVPGCRLLLLSRQRTVPVLRRALAAGVWGMIGPDVPPDRLVQAIRQVAGGERVFDRELAVAALRPDDQQLTDRERAVLSLAGEGLRSPEIAERLFLSPGTVRNYLSAAKRKIGARTRLEAFRWAREKGWL